MDNITKNDNRRDEMVSMGKGILPPRALPRALLLTAVVVLLLSSVCCSGKLGALAAISGLISDSETGVPVNDAAVSVCGKTVRSNPEGQFKLAEVSPGKQAFEIKAAAYQLLNCQVLVKPGQNDLAFNLSPLPDPVITGMVTDLYTTMPLREATVALTGNGELRSTCSTDEQGRFSFGLLQAESYQLAVSHDLYEDSIMDLQVVPGENAVEVQMTRKGLSGQVAFSSVKQGKRDIVMRSLMSGDLCPVTTDGTGNFRPSLSPDGSKILWAHEQDDLKQIHLSNIGGLDSTVVSAGPSDDYPAWAPDGSMFACQSVRAGANRIIIMDLSGTELADLGAGRFPAWSPDGGKIAFISSGKIVVADWQSGGAVTIGDRANVYYPAWSPDGKMVAYSAREGDASYILYIYDIENNASKALMSGKIHLRCSFAPNGQWIAFHTILPELSSAAQIYAVNILESDGSVLCLSGENGEHRDPSWSR
ncbi:MAG TPA: hypothetical protein DCY84_03720 [Firmicutes bacterium]|jgi:hypothetical protein|nr:hypothetical protein [Bacillota bacterium]